MQKRRVSIIIFFNNNGDILIQDRRGYKQGADYGFFGGKIEEGETSGEALKREIQEELTLDIKNFHLFKHYSRYYSEKDLSVEYYVYYSLIPKIENLIVREGKLHLTDFNNVQKLNLSENDLMLLKEFYPYLRKRKLIE